MDPNYTVISCMTIVSHADIYELTNKPDTTVAEMLVDRFMFYIDNLSINGDERLQGVADRIKCSLLSKKPYMIYRMVWSTLSIELQLKLKPTPNDVVMLINEFRTMRLKQPTVDLIRIDKKLCAVEEVFIAKAD